jgi:hypothetical protein
MGLPPLCTVGAAEFAPPASGRTALFSTDIEFDVFSSPLPELAEPVVVQLVSGFSLAGVVDCATAGPTTSTPARTAAAARIIFISCHRKHFPIHDRTFHDHDGSGLTRRWMLPGGRGRLSPERVA